MPLITDILDSLGQSCIFSTLDLFSGYWEVELDEESCQKTAFASPTGLWEFTILPFGICNAPALFQRLMQHVLAGLDSFSSVYLDDIIIFSKNFEDHMIHLEQVFQRLAEHGLTLKPKKCFFVQQEITYLGHIVTPSGLKPDPSKVQAVRDYPVPTDLGSLRRFIGMSSFYRKFVQGFATIAACLTNLTKKGISFNWTQQCQQAFETLKEKLVTAPVLAYPIFDDPTCEFFLETDASGIGLGAVLSQMNRQNETHPIAYASRALNQHEQRYATIEQEALAVVWAVELFRCYLYGRPFKVYSDHLPLKWLMSTDSTSNRLVRWRLKLASYPLMIEYCRGKDNASADALSRLQLSAAQVTPFPELALHNGDLRQAQLKDPALEPMIKYLEDQMLPVDVTMARKLQRKTQDFEMLFGVLHHTPFHNTRSVPRQTPLVVIPQKLVPEVLHYMHEAVIGGGHLGRNKTRSKIALRYYWDSMD